MSTQKELETERFIHRAVQYLKATFPEKTEGTDEDDLRDAVIDDCQTALDSGFETEADIMLLVDFLWRLPSGYAENPAYGWVAEILADADMDNKMKVDALHNALAVFMAADSDTDDEKEG